MARWHWGMMRNHPRGGSGVELLSGLEKDVMAPLCRDICKQKRAQSAWIWVNIDLSRDKYPQKGSTA